MSESQERMLAVVEPGRVDEVVAACRRWDLDATPIGTVTEGENLVARSGGEVVVDLPGPPAGRRGAGVRGAARPGAGARSRSTWRRSPSRTTSPAPGSRCSPARASPASAGSTSATTTWSGANTIRRPGGDAAVVRLPGSERAIALTTDCAERHCELDPRGGGRASVLEAARNLACVGARPVAATDCLNFPNPEKGSTGWRLAEAIARDERRAAGRWGCRSCPGTCPSTMRARRRAILPTPVVGMMGLLERADASVGHAFIADGRRPAAARRRRGHRRRASTLGRTEGRIPDVDVEREVAAIELVIRAAEEGILRSAHDVSGGGLAVALAESALAGGLGAEVRVAPGRRDDEVLFGEGGGRILVSVRAEDADRLAALSAEIGLPVRDRAPGRRGRRRDVVIHVGEREVRLPLDAARDAYEGGLPEALA